MIRPVVFDIERAQFTRGKFAGWEVVSFDDGQFAGLGKFVRRFCFNDEVEREVIISGDER